MTLPICAAPGAIVMYSLGRELYESEDMAFDLRDPQGCEGVGMPNGLSKLSERSTKCCIGLESGLLGRRVVLQAGWFIFLN